jgi:PAS domain S-box-containing protein
MSGPYRTDERHSAVEYLYRNDEHFRLLVEGVKDYAIFMLDPEGCIVTWNEGAERIKDYGAGEIIGEHFSRFYTEEDIERGHPEHELRVAASEGRYEEEGVRVRKDGSRFWASVLITALTDEEGNLRGFSKVVRDITERRQAEEELRQQAALLDLSHESIFAWKLDGGIVYWNRGSEKLYGFSREEAVGRISHELLKTVHPVPLERLRGALGREGQWIGELTHTARDGRRLAVESRQVLVHTLDGRRLVLEINRDITARKLAEQALRRSESSLAEAERIAHLGHWDYEVARDRAYWSEELYRIFGFESRSFTPTYRTFLRSVHPDDRELLRQSVRKALYDYEQGRSIIEYRIVRPDGEQRYVHTECEAERDTQGRPLRLLGTVQDITERKILEERLVYQAFHDSLSGLPNRALFLDRLGHALARLKRNDRRMAVLFMDLDDFKLINDSLGHEFGDRLLMAVGERLRRCVRAEDTVARLGGR